jgi:hypothetical protein
MSSNEQISLDKPGTPETVFTRIYADNAWRGRGSGESKSGPGSSLVYTEPLRAELPGVFERYDVHSIVDAGCGDFAWMKDVPLDGIDYTGLDVVSSVIEANQAKHGAPDKRFAKADLTADTLPRADLIIARDVLFHLPLRLGIAAVENFRQSGSKYLLSTTHRDNSVNTDIATGGFRLINLEQSPFSLPPALEYIADRGEEGHYPEGHPQHHRYLGLWELNEK